MYDKVLNPLIIKSILDKVGRDDRYTKTVLAGLTFAKLYSLLSPTEADLIKALLSIDPSSLGFKGPFVTMAETPDNLVAIEGQAFHRDGQQRLIQTQYLPEPVFEAFKSMRSAINQELSGDLLVESGYRSPAHQAVVFLTYLELSKFDIKYVASGVALPGYSQHGDPAQTALDIMNQDGVPSDEDPPELFENSKEYKWLLANAQKFGFELSYPRHNEFGVKFEPWHWRYTA
jgi:LAS superfamily LD-carboxypeptidase LdcB